MTNFKNKSYRYKGYDIVPNQLQGGYNVVSPIGNIVTYKVSSLAQAKEYINYQYDMAELKAEEHYQEQLKIMDSTFSFMWLQWPNHTTEYPFNVQFKGFTNCGDDAYLFLEKRFGETIIRQKFEGKFFYNAGLGWKDTEQEAIADMKKVDKIDGYIVEF